MFDWKYCYVGYLNMDSRTDRLAHINEQLLKLGIPFYRTRGGLPSEYPKNDPVTQVQWKRTPGSIPCMFGQIEIMTKALIEKKSVMVFEDDAYLCQDIKERFDYLQRFLNTHEWDVAWLGGTIHINPSYWHIGGINPDLPNTKLTKDAERTDDLKIIKCYGAFSTFAYIVNYDSIKKVLDLLYSVMKESMGIDWSFIRLGDQLNTFMFLPGCVKQIDGISSIGNGAMTRFSGFSKLGKYWFQENMNDFDPSTLQL